MIAQMTMDLTSGIAEGARAFGAENRAAITACTAAWLESLKRAGIDDPQTHLARMRAETDYGTAIDRHCPELRAEIAGVADGAGVPRELYFAAQLMDEDWAYRARRKVRADIPDKCSSAAIRLVDGVAAGQNMDLGGYTDSHQCLVRVAANDGRPAALIFTLSNMIGLMGVNEAGLSVHVNSLPALPSAADGLPVAFMIRMLLGAATIAEAAARMTGLPHATSQHYLICDSRAIRSFEAAPSEVVELSTPETDRIVHTNHALAPAFSACGAPSVNSATRLACLERRLVGAPASVDALLAALASRDDPEHPVSREAKASQRPSDLTGMTSFTTGTLVTHLGRSRTEPAAIWASAGPPSARGYDRITEGIGQHP